MTADTVVAVAVIAFALDGRAVAVPVDAMVGTGAVITGGSGASGGSGLTGAGAGGIVGHSPVIPGGTSLVAEAVAGDGPAADGPAAVGPAGDGGAGEGEPAEGEPSDGMACVGTAGEGELPFVGLVEGAAPGGVIGDTCGD